MFSDVFQPVFRDVNKGPFDERGAAFSPLDLPNLELWLDASADGTNGTPNTITETAGFVSQWDDRSGNANHAVQGTASNQLSTGVDTINGLNVLTGGLQADTRMDLTNNINISADFSIYIVAEPDNNTTEMALISQDNTNGTHIAAQPSGKVRFRTNNGGGENTTLNTPTVPARVSMIRGGTNVDVAVNGSTSSFVTTLGSDAVDRIAGDQFVNEFVGKYAEVIVFNRALSAGEQTLIESYIDTKWGL